MRTAAEVVEDLLDRKGDLLAHEAAEMIESQQSDRHKRIEVLATEVERLRLRATEDLSRAFRAGWDFRDAKSVPAQQLNDIQDERYRELVDVDSMVTTGFAEWLETVT